MTDTTHRGDAADLVNDYPRTALAFAHDGSATSLDEARQRLHGTTVHIRVGDRACRTTSGQAATLTAVATLSRTFGTVRTEVPRPEQPVQAGPYPGLTLHQALTRVHQGSGEIDDDPAPAPPLVQILIGDAEPTTTSCPVIRASWNGWTAVSGPRAATPGSDDHPLTGIAAAAMAATDAFAIVQRRPGAGAVTRTLDLWNPGPTNIPSVPCPGATDLALPPAWHLIGLGHLGQAAAWCLTFLPYRHGEPHVLLQDTDLVVPANVSTGVLSTPADTRRAKTRLVAEHLERAGATTRIIERRLDPHHRRDPGEPGLALVGVDNLTTRQILDRPGWDLAIDLGLGHGAHNFTEIAMHCIDTAHRPDAVTGWTARTTPVTRLPSTPAFAHYDNADPIKQCGVIDLAGRAVGASFVGVLAAVLGINEALRRIAGAPPMSVLTLDARRPDHAVAAYASSTAGLLAIPPAKGTA